ncbi:hypothetical protein D9611_000514 [Ephemerocybe angulata]|uniref:Uncharacterized protein n=1 Tax=Ephemerocybe angulata TaxID=980116 RepID=A0A8H5F7X6_9AGAR|nr:hypothetical protein D9611_000514 [Tulosesus angulatus]
MTETHTRTHAVLGTTRLILHALLWACAVILLALTAYRVHYTKRLNHDDILTSSHHFYDPVIVELIVTSCLVIIGSLWTISILAKRRVKGSAWGFPSFAGEAIYVWVVWVMLLVGASITTHRWLHLKWCRGHHKECRILEAIKGFSWICYGLASFILMYAIAEWLLMDYERRTAPPPTYPETRTAQPEPVPAATETTYTEVRASNEPPVSTTAPAATETTYTEVRAREEPPVGTAAV